MADKNTGYKINNDVEGVDEARLSKALSEMGREIVVDGIKVALVPLKVYEDFTKKLGQTPEEYISINVGKGEKLRGFMEEASRHGEPSEIVTGMLESKLAAVIEKTEPAHKLPEPEPGMAEAITAELGDRLKERTGRGEER